MSIDELKMQIRELIERPLAAEGAELVDMVVSRYKNNNALRLFVYSTRGMTIDECARLSRLVGDIIDGTGIFQSGYTLEVSSPGLDRPLTTEADFRHRIGETVRVEFVDEKKKKVTAEISGISNSQVEFNNDEGAFTVDLAEIDKAKIQF